MNPDIKNSPSQQTTPSVQPPAGSFPRKLVIILVTAMLFSALGTKAYRLYLQLRPPLPVPTTGTPIPSPIPTPKTTVDLTPPQGWLLGVVDDSRLGVHSETAKSLRLTELPLLTFFYPSSWKFEMVGGQPHDVAVWNQVDYFQQEKLTHIHLYKFKDGECIGPREAPCENSVYFDFELNKVVENTGEMDTAYFNISESSSVVEKMINGIRTTQVFYPSSDSSYPGKTILHLTPTIKIVLDIDFFQYEKDRDLAYEQATAGEINQILSSIRFVQLDEYRNFLRDKRQ